MQVGRSLTVKFNRFNGVTGSSLSYRDRIEKATAQFGCQVKPDDGLVVVGTPVGSAEFRQQFVSDNADSLILDLSTLDEAQAYAASLPKHTPVAQALRLVLVMCYVPRLAHLLQNLYIPRRPTP
jgi:hypothetical protein